MVGERVVKMSGSGNDFVVLGRGGLDRLGGDVAWIRRVCRRRLAVGADGVLFVEPVGPGRVRVEFRNPDGSRAFCGNGTRCAARFAHLEGWVGDEMLLVTAAGDVRAELDGGRVTLHLPAPRDLGARRIQVGEETLAGRHVEAGVPHFVVITDDLAGSALERYGPAVRRHPEFGPDGVNFDLVRFDPANGIALRTWERGVEGETLACGSGAVAAAFATGLVEPRESGTVIPASGIPLEVRLLGPRERPTAAVVTGDARVILDGTLSIEATGGFPAPSGS